MSPVRLFLSSMEAAEILGITYQTLANWRRLHKGPAFHKLGARTIGYKPDDLLAWVDSLKMNANNQGAQND